MELPRPLQHKIIDFLKSLPNLDDTKSQRAFIYQSGLDLQLQEQISFGEPSVHFVPLLVSTLLNYGRLNDGQYAIKAVLETSKQYVGQDKKAYCESLIQEVHANIVEEAFEFNRNTSVDTRQRITIPFSLTFHHSFLPAFFVLILLIGAMIGVGFLAKNSLLSLLERYSRDFGIFTIYTGFVGVSLIAAVVMFGVMRSTGVFKKMTRKGQYEFGGAMVGFLITLMFLIGTYQTSQPTALTIIGHVRFVKDEEFLAPVEGAKIALSKLSGFSTKTDEQGNFRLQLPENREIQEIELQVTYEGKTIYHPVKREELEHVNILFPMLPPPDPKQMTGDFRVAVAEFALSGEEEQDIGYELAETAYSGVKAAFEELKLGIRVETWGPNKLVEKITGNTSDERAESAENIAANIGAHIVVYGVVDTTEPPVWEITPEFYVSDRNFYEAQEITGQHAMGEPFLVDPVANVSGRIAVIDEMKPRIKLLSHIIVGLSHYAYHKFEKALEVFQSIEQNEIWEQTGGKNILYLLIGNSAGKLDKLDVAEESYTKALELDGEYARAYIGLASVYYIKALRDIRNPDGTQNPEKVNKDLINESIEFYKKAVSADHQPAISDVPTKVSFGLGQCYLMLIFTGETVDAAIREFETVIAEYGDGANPRIGQLAAESHARLGLIYRIKKDIDAAIREYEKAASLSHKNKDTKRRDMYEKIAQELKEKRGELP